MSRSGAVCSSAAPIRTLATLARQIHSVRAQTQTGSHRSSKRSKVRFELGGGGNGGGAPSRGAASSSAIVPAIDPPDPRGGRSPLLWTHESRALVNSSAAPPASNEKSA